MLSLVPQTNQADEFYDIYFDYVGITECPKLFHRWSAITCVAALLSRNVWFPFGHWTIFPNIFVMLMGVPGTRKSTAIITAKKALERIGYEESLFSADRTSKERFLMDMMRTSEDTDVEELQDMMLDGITSELFIVADEFLDFIGKGNLEFLTMLGKLWDCPPQYRHPKLHGKSIVVPGPLVNCLSGCTPQNAMLVFPPEAIGSGYMSRNIYVHGDPTGVKITIPPKPSEEACKKLDKRLNEIRTTVKGEITLTKGASDILDRMYKEFIDIDDYRFKHYSTRRFTNLLKLSLLFAASRVSKVIDTIDCLKANTLLHYTELKMPKALGEFGKSRNADVANTIMEILKGSKVPVTAKYLWKQVVQDLDRKEELEEILTNLRTAEKIQIVEVGGKQGYQPKFVTRKTWDDDLLLDNFLTEGEKA